jgi:hypothetical protein
LVATVNVPPLWLPVAGLAVSIIWALFVALHALRKQRDAQRMVGDYEASIDRLGEAFDSGTALLNRPISSEVELGQWISHWNMWRGNVEAQLIAEFGQRERYLFRNSVLYDLVLDGINAQHAELRNQLVRKLEMLRETITRHCNQAALWRKEVE